MKSILINLDLKNNSYEEIELKQGCQDTVIATITDLGDAVDLTGQVISVEMLKGDKTFIIQTNDVTVSANKVTIKLNKDFTRVKGKAKLQIKMTKSGVVSGSWVVIAWVREGAIDSAIGESGNIVTIKEELDNSIVKATEENKKTQDLIQNGGAATKGQVEEISSQLADITHIVDSSDKLSDILLNINSNSKIKTNTEILVNNYFTFNKPFIFDGYNNSFKVVKQNNDIIFKIVNVDGFIIKNIKFDNNLLGRTIIDIVDCKNFIIENCSFTGYSKEYGYYKTDSAIRINGISENGNIENCTFKNFGNQYGHLTDELNRCVTINDTTCKNINVSKCDFINFNQGVVGVGDNIIIENCNFEGAKDNPIYIDSPLLKVNSNTFLNNDDEVIVVSGGVIEITNNTIKNYKNKAIAINGDTNIIKVDNNIIVNDNDIGQVLISRNATYVLDYIKFTSNTFIQKTKIVDTSPLFDFALTKDLEFNNNYISTMQTSTSKKVINGSINSGSINNNTFISDIDVLTVFSNDVIATNLTINDNFTKNCRIRYGSGSNTRFSKIQPNVPYLAQSKINFLTCSTKPTDVSYFKKGDIIMNENPLDTSEVGWVTHSDGNIRPFGNLPQFRAGSPVNWIKPRFIGDIAVDTVNKKAYIGVLVGEQTVDAWLLMN